MESQAGEEHGAPDLSKNIDDLLKKIYYDSKNPVSFSGINKIYQYVKRNYDIKISRGKIKKWLSKQETYTSHFPVKRKFVKPRVLAFYEDYQWDTDTANMVQYEKYNDGYKYFVVFIDIFTRFLYTKNW